ncbi:MAG TPA: hypothetical protein VGO67_16220 [Verrucomicrobiae bacterium]|jgi:predicted RNA-binding Zn-ribbon protein involved in translation (DUF1610 family)
MKSIASLEIDVAAKLTQRLTKEAIPYEVYTVTQEGGLDYADVMVEDEYYERACDVAESWEADRVAQIQKESGRRCPSCGSANFEHVDESSLGGNIWKCKKCGKLFAI